jgi:inorganic pyrophosphatase
VTSASLEPAEHRSTRRLSGAAARLGSRTIEGRIVDQDLIDIVIEIPTGSRNKYEYDHDKHLIRLDRRLFSATVYPADYGFLPDTLAEDGDPLDALVLVEDPTFPGCVVRARALGVFWMEDENGPDAKIVSVLQRDPKWDQATGLDDIPRSLLDEIEHFFAIYKDLEPGKMTVTKGFGGLEQARAEIAASRRRYEVATS